MLEIATERLVLRPLEIEHAAAFAAYRAQPDVARYQSWDTTYSPADAALLPDFLVWNGEEVFVIDTTAVATTGSNRVPRARRRFDRHGVHTRPMPRCSIPKPCPHRNPDRTGCPEYALEGVLLPGASTQATVNDHRGKGQR